ncbi:MAG TPA: DoxX family protein [Sphingomicrobium sp.]|jgi:putative oxidoreductase|nr:DoxX family protein [Sphingomicrobium sp.]
MNMRDSRPDLRVIGRTFPVTAPRKSAPMQLRHLERYQAGLRAALRIMTALLFMEHGLAKLVHFPVPHPGVPDPLPAILVAAAWIELVGGALIAIGLFTRAVAFLAAGEMATGYFLFHFPQGFWPIVNMGEAAILYCFVFLYLAAAGPGVFSVDAALEKKG